MTDHDALARLRELDEKATPGPWEPDYDPFEDQNYATCIILPGYAGQMGTQIARCDHNWNEAGHGERRISWAEAQANAALIVALRNDAMRIIEQQAAEIARLRDAGNKLNEVACHTDVCEIVTHGVWSDPISCTCSYTDAWKAWEEVRGND